MKFNELKRLVNEIIFEESNTPELNTPEGNVWYLHILDVANMDDPSYQLIGRVRRAIDSSVLDPHDLQICKDLFNKEFGGGWLAVQDRVSALGGKPQMGDAWNYYAPENLKENIQSDKSSEASSIMKFASEHPDIIKQMRDWISDCSWPDLDPEEVNNLSPVEVIMGVHKHYDGGIADFIRSCGTEGNGVVAPVVKEDGNQQPISPKKPSSPMLKVNNADGPYTVYVKQGIRSGQTLFATKDKQTGMFYYLNPDTATYEYVGNADNLSIQEGVGYVHGKDIKKDPKHIKGERWRIKYQSSDDLKKHGNTEVSSVNEIFKNKQIKKFVKEIVSEIWESNDLGKEHKVTSRDLDDTNVNMLMPTMGSGLPPNSYDDREDNSGPIISFKDRRASCNYGYFRRALVRHYIRKLGLSASEAIAKINKTPAESDINERINDQVHSISKPVKVNGEWIVKWMVNGIRDEDRTYYTDDKQDAIDTYHYMLQDAARLNLHHT